MEALARPFSPAQLDWELVGVAFVEVPAVPDPGVEVWVIEERPDGAIVGEQVDVTVVDERGEPVPFAELADANVVEAMAAVELDGPVQIVVEDRTDTAVAEEPTPGPVVEAVREPPAVPLSPHAVALAAAAKRKRKWVREHDQIMAALRDLSWEGYCSLIADIFRREGYQVFVGEGDDGDVIDMEVLQGEERMVVNCQLRGIGEIDAAPVAEMMQVAARNGAQGAFIISDGDFTADAWSFAEGQPVVLIDRDSLLGLVLDFTLGTDREKRLGARLARLLRGPEDKGNQKAS